MNNNLLEYKLDLIAAHLGVYRIDEVAAVMRRQHVAPEDGRIVDVVDFYPEWNAFGTYGKMKLCHEYMDEEWQIKRFEKYAGVTLDSLPIYDGQQALSRRFGQTHRCEMPVRPFRLMTQPRTDDKGNNAKTLILRYLSSPETRRGNAPQPAPQTAPITPPERPAAPKPAGVQIPEKDWLNETITAANQDDFAISISRLHPELFDDANRAAKLWESMFRGLPYRQDHAIAYLNAMKECATRFSEQQAAGKEKAIAYAEAKTAGMERYETTLDLISRAPTQAEMPLPGGNNYARS